MKLHYKRMGSGRSIVILHGLFGSSDNWGTVGKTLSDDFDVTLVDARDHGRSIHTDRLSYPLMSEDLKELFDELDLKDVVLVGHSMGGKTAMEFAQRHPELLHALIVVDISPREHENSHEQILEALMTADLERLSSRSEVEKHLRGYIKEPGVIQFLMKSLYWDTPGRLAWRLNIPGIAGSIDDILAATGAERVVTPTWFIRGGQSEYITREDIPAIREQFPKAQILTIEHAGHWVHAQAPDEVVEIIRNAAQ